MSDKPLEWVGSAHSELQAFPDDARRVAGFQLRRVQRGFEPNDWKPMATVGPGVKEIRIRTDLAHRVFYVATFEEAVYVVHAFEKKTGRTAHRDLELGRRRFRELLPDDGGPMRKKNRVKVTPSTGNVFRNLGFPPEEAEHLLIRADLMIELQRRIEAEGMSQAAAAKLLRVTQPRISDLLRGRIDLFSTDALIDMLARLGVQVRVLVKPTRRKVANDQR